MWYFIIWTLLQSSWRNFYCLPNLLRGPQTARRAARARGLHPCHGLLRALASPIATGQRPKPRPTPRCHSETKPWTLFEFHFSSQYPFFCLRTPRGTWRSHLSNVLHLRWNLHLHGPSRPPESRGAVHKLCWPSGSVLFHADGSCA